MSELLVPFLSWYLVIQLLSLAVLPLCVRLFANLPTAATFLPRCWAFCSSASRSGSAWPTVC